MEKHARGEMAANVLKFLLLGGFIATCFVLPNFAQVYRLFGPKRYVEKQRIRQSLKRLEKKKLIKIYYRDGEKVISLTSSGEKRALKQCLADLKLEVPKKWDRMWTVVIFDVPEDKRSARRNLCANLNAIGFYPLQKSTFIAPCRCEKEIDLLGNFLEVREHIVVMRVESIENEAELLKHFSLKK